MTDNFARLLALMGGSGGSGGTTDYNDLINKPTVGGTTLSGDLTLADLGYIVDNIINAESTNPVQNAVIAAALSNLSYNNLSNKPSINNVTLTGNTTLKQLGLNAIWVGTSAEFEIDKDTIANGTLIFITDNDIVDSVPTQNSTNLVESGGVYSFVMGGLSDKVDKVNGKGLSTEDYTTAEKTKLAGIEDEATRTWVGTSAEYMQQASSIPAGTPIIITDDVDTDATPTQNSINPVQSGGVYDALANKVDKVSGKGLSTEDYTTAEKTKLGGIEAEANKTVVDSALDGTSTNPVQNQVVKGALDLKANTADLGTAASKDVPVSGNASATQVVLGNDDRLAWMDTNGDIYFGQTRIARLMDYDSYIALATKDNIYYLTYPTPTNGRSLSKGGESININVEDIIEVDKKEELKETDELKESEEVKENPMEIKGGEK